MLYVSITTGSALGALIIFGNVCQIYCVHVCEHTAVSPVVREFQWTTLGKLDHTIANWGGRPIFQKQYGVFSEISYHQNTTSSCILVFKK